jgi:hypothetical protein
LSKHNADVKQLVQAGNTSSRSLASSSVSCLDFVNKALSSSRSATSDAGTLLLAVLVPAQMPWVIAAQRFARATGDKPENLASSTDKRASAAAARSSKAAKLRRSAIALRPHSTRWCP